MRSVNSKRSGNYLAIGDVQGRVIIFESFILKKKNSEAQKNSFSFVYLTEGQCFQSELDWQKSQEICAGITSISKSHSAWVNHDANGLSLLVSNAAQIALFKFNFKTRKKIIFSNEIGRQSAWQCGR